MLSADRVERNQQAAPQHIPLEWHTDFGGEEMAEASERQVALPGRVGKPDGACLDEPINRLRGSHDARIERSARFKCEPSLPEAGAAVARDMDLLHAVQARFQIVWRTELDRRLDIPELRVAPRSDALTGFGGVEQATLPIVMPPAFHPLL